MILYIGCYITGYLFLFSIDKQNTRRLKLALVYLKKSFCCHLYTYRRHAHAQLRRNCQFIPSPIHYLFCLGSVVRACCYVLYAYSISVNVSSTWTCRWNHACVMTKTIYETRYVWVYVVAYQYWFFIIMHLIRACFGPTQKWRKISQFGCRFK